MGRRTWESIPDKFRPLPHRLNVVLSRDPTFRAAQESLVAPTLDVALRTLDRNRVANTFIIGGGQVYAEAIVRPECLHIYLTAISAEFDCDVYFPNSSSDFVETACGHEIREGAFTYHFRLLTRHGR